MTARLARFALLLLLWSPLGFAEPPQAPAAPPAAPTDEALFSQSIARLADIRRQVFEKQRDLQFVREQLGEETNAEKRADLQRRADDLPKTIDRLNSTFDQVATGGIDVSALSEQPPEQFDWKEELLEITKPLISSLKELTEKPRKIENLRAQIATYQDQMDAIDKALASIKRYEKAKPPQAVVDRLETIARDWTQRKTDVASNLEIARYQLATLSGQEISYWQMIGDAARAFVAGRGLTLLLAATAVVFVWLLARLGLYLILRFTRVASSTKSYRNRERGIRYLYRLSIGVFSIVAVLLVFYARSDLLLLALTVIALAMLAAGLRQTVPKYIKEIRILLDFGSVREGERIVYGGVPMEVKAIQTFAVLRNPELEGIVRLPIDQLVDLVSRPAGEEPWFPSQIGDFMLLADGGFAQVLRQTIEFVQLRMVESIVQIPTATFMQSGARNLTREGYGIRAAFGIDYRHQAICLDPVPRLMHEAVTKALKAAPFGQHLRDVTVEFKEAGANSLDYLVYARMTGAAAGNYFAAQRVMQRALVELCNREGWVIPFAQLTLHQGEGFDGLRVATVGAG